MAMVAWTVSCSMCWMFHQCNRSQAVIPDRLRLLSDRSLPLLLLNLLPGEVRVQIALFRGRYQGHRPQGWGRGASQTSFYSTYKPRPGQLGT